MRFIASVGILLAFLLFGCGGKDSNNSRADSSSAKNELHVWDWHYTQLDEGPGRWLLELDKEFESRHPGVKIRHRGVSFDQYDEIIMATASAATPGQPPDVVMLLPGNRIQRYKDHLRPLNDLIDPAMREEIRGWDMVADDYNVSQTLRAVPVATQGNVWYYNKPLLKSAGYDPENPPREWDAFIACCRKLKSMGKTGIAMGMKQGYWYEGWWHSSMYFQVMNPSEREHLIHGRLPFTCPQMVELARRFVQLSESGCFPEGAVSTPLFPDSGEMFMRGDAGFFLGLLSDVAHWKQFGEMIGYENLGIMKSPIFGNREGAEKIAVGPGVTYAITRWSQRADLAMEYIRMAVSREQAARYMSIVGSFPSNRNFDHSVLERPIARTLAEWIDSKYAAPSLHEIWPLNLAESLRKNGQLLMLGQMTPEKVLDEADRCMADWKRKQEKKKT